MTRLRVSGDLSGFLGIEGGATRTRAVLADAAGHLLAEAEAGPANIQLLTDAQLLKLLGGLRAALPRPSAIAMGLAGARRESDRQRIRRAAARIWPGIPCYATNDLETALMAAVPDRKPGPRREPARVLVLSGTGSCCYGRTPRGEDARTGGWGHVLGDRGSAYDIGLRALRETLRQYDLTGRLGPLGRRLLRKLASNSPEDWVAWSRSAGKSAVAAIAPEVFAAYADDPLARTIVRAAAAELAIDACACAARVRRAGQPMEFILAGGVLLRQPVYARWVRHGLRTSFPGAAVRRLGREAAWGAFELARAHFGGRETGAPVRHWPGRPIGLPVSRIPCPDLASLAGSPTEQRNPRSRRFSHLPLAAAVRLMLNEDRRIPPALLRERARIERAVAWITRAFRCGGRLFYVGAGTSGRLGVLDASECPPTFRTPPDLVQGIIAGGPSALWESIEGAEDDAEAGAEALRLRAVTPRDLVLGIATSGRTPFVWGALWQARRAGARTLLLCFNPHLRLSRDHRPDLVIAPDVGPEILTGSTRLKAGTATKLVLNVLTTVAMTRLGKVVGNLMVDLNPSNTKLRHRAIRIVRQLTGRPVADARSALERNHWMVRQAVRALGTRAGGR
jgi:N-acetylmuramic acid 6-phosphate etherase